MRSFAILLFLVVPALADSPKPPVAPTFTAEEVQAAYALGAADALRNQLAQSTAARSMADKMRQQPKKP